MNKILIGILSLIHLMGSKLLFGNNIKFALKEEIACSSRIKTIGSGKIYFGNSVHLMRNVHVKANNEAIISIGNHTSFNNGCMIVARDAIEIGDNCSIGPNVMIYDHDHDFKSCKSIKQDEYIASKIYIGSNVWIGAGATILRNSYIGENVVIGAGTVVKGKIDDDTLVYTKQELVKKNKQ